ncbi:MAG: wax ester/triacylglycerol synthase family O-acyltransferase [Pyrinomonadaceae bacterium]|nr:wax ester/triacylglycerol synthase family O-acyltransferase [Pyrinomonadaceae bacterium]MCX7639227.1 wax ester/triacylglycerol synthase family O-acyltransferase [Pyrinomonadaceae bacterium]MDW8303551.1 wax ester/triacylglycerol synthase family O-acyltransferase [Acidobacteriota bacterium]
MKPKLRKYLSTLDAAFLYLERKECPMNIGAACIFEGKLTYDSLLKHIEDRLPLVPRYLQKLSPDPFNITHPSWELDRKFSIKKHVIKVKQKKTFNKKDLENFMGKLMSELMDRSKPLWELYLIEDFEGGGSAIIAKIHHCMADGISGIDIMKVMFDVTAKAEKPETQPIPDEPQKDLTEKLLDSFFNTLQEEAKNFLALQGGIFYLLSSFTKPELINSLPEIAELIPAISSPPFILPFNRECSGERRLAWTEFSFKDARKIRDRLGGTVNDVVLTALTKSVSEYTKLHKQSVKDKFVRFMVPVSLRQKEERGSLGNLISFLPVEIPIDIEETDEIFRYVNRKMNLMKNAHIAETLMLFGAAYGMLPPPIQAAIGAIVDLPFPPFNMVATNVPGPQIPLYLAGRKMVEQYPYVPVGYRLGLGCAILSYDKKLYFGLSSDKQAMPDVEKFKQILDDTLSKMKGKYCA